MYNSIYLIICCLILSWFLLYDICILVVNIFIFFVLFVSVFVFLWSIIFFESDFILWMIFLVCIVFSNLFVKERFDFGSFSVFEKESINVVKVGEWMDWCKGLLFFFIFLESVNDFY